MLAVDNTRFWAIAPDFRGYGLSEMPSEPEKASFNDLIEDLLAVLNYYDIPKAFFIAKDFGVRPAYFFTLLHPERLAGHVTVGVSCIPPEYSLSFQRLPGGFYVLRWQAFPVPRNMP